MATRKRSSSGGFSLDPVTEEVIETVTEETPEEETEVQEEPQELPVVEGKVEEKEPPAKVILTEPTHIHVNPAPNSPQLTRTRRNIPRFSRPKR